MISEPFAFGDSLVHRIDPRIRVIFAVLYSFAVALSNSLVTLLAALAASLLLVLLARLDGAQVLKRLKVVAGFVLLMWLVLPLTFEGAALLRLGPVTLTRPGVLLSAAITLKSTAILLAFIALAATLSFSELGRALHRLGCPGKFVHHLLITYRYIYVIEAEYHRLTRAARIRSFRPKTSLHTYKTYAYMVGMLFVRASERAVRVHRAMCCRGFDGRFYCLTHFPATHWNWFFALLMTGILSGLAALEYLKPPLF